MRAPLLFLLRLSFLAAALPAPASAATAAQAERALAHLTTLHTAAGAPGVSAAVALDGRIVFSAGVGVTDLQSGAKITGRSPGGIGALSSLLATVAVMQLVEQGKVNLDAEIQTYAPWFPKKEKPITVRQLLTHTSGLRHYKEGEFGPGNLGRFRAHATLDEATKFWRDDPLVFAPGTAWMFSTYGAALLQAVIETAGAMPFENYLRRHVLDPAAMPATQLDLPARIVKGRILGYRRDAATRALLHADEENVSYKFASGGFLASAEDLCRFGAALEAGRLLKPVALAEMFRLQLPADLKRHNPGAGPAPGETTALAWRIMKDRDGRMWAGHSARIKGVDSFIVSYRSERLVVAVLTNLIGGVDVVAAAEGLAKIYLPPATSQP